MKKLLVTLPLGLLMMPLYVFAQTEAPVAQNMEQSTESAFSAALTQVLQSQSEDLYSVAVAVLQSGGTEADFFRLMNQACDAANPVAQKWKAQLLLQSVAAAQADLLTSPDAMRARELMKAAAEAGYVPAQVEMARYAGIGVGAAASESEGLRYLMQACRSGSSRARAAYLLLSGRLNTGKFDAPEIASELGKNNYHLEEVIASLYGDSAEALEWLEKASAHGSPSAAFMLGQSKLQSDEAAALALLKLSAERHLPEALATHGVIQMSQQQGKEGLQNLQLAFMLGYTPAASTLAAQFILQAETYSPERVFELYRLGDALQDARSSVAYAYCLVTGRGCSAAQEKGVEMLRQLADDGSPYANVALADLYFNGCGVESNMMKAVNYLGEADAAGVPNAYVLMAVLTQLGNAAAAPDSRRAELYLKMAAERGEQNPQQLFDAMIQQKEWHFLPSVRK
ncbi:MAG: sel1 repeat family protein [Akkermansia sp.]|nr:sel1 repeat family protein [Akkermansia sp.]